MGVTTHDRGTAPSQSEAVLVWGAQGRVSGSMAAYLAGHFGCVWQGAPRQEVLRSVVAPVRAVTVDPGDPVGLGIARAILTDAGPPLAWGLLLVEPDPEREGEDQFGAWLDATGSVCRLGQSLGTDLPMVLAFPQTRGAKSELVGAHVAAGALGAWAEARRAAGGAGVRLLPLPPAWWHTTPTPTSVAHTFREGPPGPGWDLRPSLRRGARRVLGRLGWEGKTG